MPFCTKCEVHVNGAKCVSCGASSSSLKEMNQKLFYPEKNKWYSAQKSNVKCPTCVQSFTNSVSLENHQRNQRHYRG